MASLVRIRIVTASRLKPTSPPDGSSLEERVNVVLAPITFSHVLSVQVHAMASEDEGDIFTAVITHREVY